MKWLFYSTWRCSGRGSAPPSCTPCSSTGSPCTSTGTVSGRPKQFLHRNTDTKTSISDKPSFVQNGLFYWNCFFWPRHYLLSKTFSFGRLFNNLVLINLLWPKQSLLAKYRKLHLEPEPFWPNNWPKRWLVDHSLGTGSCGATPRTLTTSCWATWSTPTSSSPSAARRGSRWIPGAGSRTSSSGAQSHSGALRCVMLLLTFYMRRCHTGWQKWLGTNSWFRSGIVVTLAMNREFVLNHCCHEYESLYHQS